jgi:hypothetical protein
MTVAVDTAGADVDDALRQGIGRDGGKKVFQPGVVVTFTGRRCEVVNDCTGAGQIGQRLGPVQIGMDVNDVVVIPLAAASQGEDMCTGIQPALRKPLADIAVTNNKYPVQGFAPRLNVGKSVLV